MRLACTYYILLLINNLNVTVLYLLTIDNFNRFLKPFKRDQNDIIIEEYSRKFLD